jgi:hypothetical protein
MKSLPGVIKNEMGIFTDWHIKASNQLHVHLFHPDGGLKPHIK